MAAGDPPLCGCELNESPPDLASSGEPGIGHGRGMKECAGHEGAHRGVQNIKDDIEHGGHRTWRRVQGMMGTEHEGRYRT